MRAATGNTLSTAELIRKELSGEKIAPPSFHRLPLYDAPNYKQFVQDAMSKATSSDYNPSQSITVEIDTGKNTSDYNFGQTHGSASVGASVGWFSFSAGASHSSESSTLQTGSESSKVSVKITYDDIQAITVNLGSWYVIPFLVRKRPYCGRCLIFLLTGTSMFPSTSSAQMPPRMSRHSPGSVRSSSSAAWATRSASVPRLPRPLTPS